MSLEEKFKAAVNVIKSLPKDGPYQPSNEMKLLFYGLFKQATEGPCRGAQPSWFNPVARYKWQAWHDLGELTVEEAMTRYVSELKKIVETMSYSADVATFIDVLGPFYEYVEIRGDSKDENHNVEHEKKFENSSEFALGAEADVEGITVKLKSEVVSEEDHEVTLEDYRATCHDVVTGLNDHMRSPIVNEAVNSSSNYAREPSPVEDADRLLQPLTITPPVLRVSSDTDTDDEFHETIQEPIHPSSITAGRLLNNRRVAQSECFGYNTYELSDVDIRPSLSLRSTDSEHLHRLMTIAIETNTFNRTMYSQLQSLSQQVDILQALVTANTRQITQPRPRRGGWWRWLVSDLSLQAGFFLFLWPVLLQLVVWALRRRRTLS